MCIIIITITVLYYKFYNLTKEATICRLKMFEWYRWKLLRCHMYTCQMQQMNLCLCPSQSHPEAEWLPVWEQCPACLLHPWWELWAGGKPEGVRLWPSTWLWLPRRAPRWFPELRDARQSSARRHPSETAGTHTVRRCHHWQGGSHHS